MSGACVEVWRGDQVESRHRVRVAVVDGSGRLRAFTGEVEEAVFARSAVKPVQAVPLVEDGVLEVFGMGDAELALACASHSGEQRHVDLAGRMLRGIGLDETALACGPHWPLHEAAAEALRKAGVAPGRLHNNCSGKHCGMLALARSRGWRVHGYHEPMHEVQLRMLAEVARWSHEPDARIRTALDGCGVVTFALPLRALAGIFGRLGAAARGGETGAGRVVHAMVTCPELVGGTNRLCTELMRAAGGRIFAKVGAEGVYCAGVPGAELGIALKVEDGASRAAGPALLAVLRQLALLSAEEAEGLAGFAEPDILNTRMEVVGGIRTRVKLELEG